jgi:hypothetical protein
VKVSDARRFVSELVDELKAIRQAIIQPLGESTVRKRFAAMRSKPTMRWQVPNSKA